MERYTSLFESDHREYEPGKPFICIKPFKAWIRGELDTIKKGSIWIYNSLEADLSSVRLYPPEGDAKYKRNNYITIMTDKFDDHFKRYKGKI